MAGASLRVGANTSEFTSQMRQMLNQMKLVTSEYKVEAAAAKALGSQTDLLKAKKTELTKNIKLQTSAIKLQESNLTNQKQKLTELIEKEEKAKQKVAELAKAHEESVKATGKDSEESQKLNKQLEEAKEAHAKATNAVKKQDDAITKNTAKLNESKAKLIEQKTALKSTEDELTSAGNKWTVFGHEIQTVGGQMDDAGNKTLKLGDVIKANLISSAIISGVKQLAEGIKQLAMGAVGVGSDFEAGMSQVAATMGMTTQEIAGGSEEFTRLENAAKDAGNTTQFSATQASQALNFMALAGYDADKAIETLPTVLNLAAAGGMDLATASDMVTDSMSALGDKAGTTESFVDKMAKTSQKSNTSVQQLGEALLSVGGTAKSLAGGVTEANTVLGIFADSGTKGAEGGTALRNVILSLTAPTDTAKEKISELGLKVFDANGNMRPLNETFNDLNSILSGMTQGEQTEVLNTIFNKVDLKSVNALLANSGERFNELSGYIENSTGAAANMAATMNDNLQGKVTILKSGLEGLGIAAYEKFETPLKNAVANVTNVISDLQADMTSGELDGVLDKIATGFGNLLETGSEVVAAVLPKVLEGLGWIADHGDTIISVLSGVAAGFAAFKVVSIINGVIGALSGLQASLVAVRVIQALVNATLAANPMMFVITLLITGVAAIAGYIAANKNARAAVINVWNNIKTTIGNVVDAIVTFFTQTIPNALTAVITFFQQLPGNIWNAIIGAVDQVTAWGESMKAAAVQAVTGFITNVVTFFGQLPYNVGYIIGLTIGYIIQFGVNIVSWAVTAIPNFITTVVTFFQQLPGNIWNAIVGAIAYIRNWGSQMLSNAKSAALNILNSVVSTLSQMPGRISSAIQGAISAVAAWGSRMMQQGANAARQLVSAVVSGVSGLPGKMQEVGHNIVQGVWNGISNAAGWFKSKVNSFFSGIVDGVKGALGIHSPSTVFRDEVGRYMAQGAGVGFTEELDHVENEIDNRLGNLVQRTAKITPIAEVKQSAKIVALNRQDAITRYVDNSKHETETVMYVTNIIELDGEEISRRQTKKVIKKISDQEKDEKIFKGA